MGAFEFEYELTPEELVEEHGYMGLLGRFGVGRALAYLPQILMGEEKIVAITRGLISLSPWLLVVTNLRVILLSQGYLFGYKLLEIPLSCVKMIYHSLGLFFGEIVFNCGDTQTRLRYVNKRSLPSLMPLLAEAMAGGPVSEKIAPQAERLSQLERLAALKAKGALSEAEFLAQKKKILASR
ncbi:MAG: PH domain-containing protein [Deltaproteobacteria bacterium]|jgi:hypothetical protein|nr:PH domain-containing protein [Deltaproteobacteria bacterium]